VFNLKARNTKLIKDKARELGFDYCGISKAGFLEEEAPRLERWLKEKRHGQMAWMENYFDKRLDPTKLVEGSKSVISLLLNYYPEKNLKLEEHKISRYAYGKDYHFTIKDKLKTLIGFIEEAIGAVQARVFVDSAPVMDKAWAKKSGLGWAGKNSLLINPKAGSYFFIAEIIADLELEEDGSIKDYCGTCTRCIDACPTDALSNPYQVDASRCISYLTIELKEAIPDEFKGKMGNWVFGCDICQEVCPWNRFSTPNREKDFEVGDKLKDFTDTEMKEITQEVFGDLFKRSALKRTKFEGLKRNIKFLENND